MINLLPNKKPISHQVEQNDAFFLTPQTSSATHWLQDASNHAIWPYMIKLLPWIIKTWKFRNSIKIYNQAVKKKEALLQDPVQCYNVSYRLLLLNRAEVKKERNARWAWWPVNFSSARRCERKWSASPWVYCLCSCHAAVAHSCHKILPTTM